MNYFHICECCTHHYDVSIPGTSDEERSKLLNFVIVGGGPTGVEVSTSSLSLSYVEYLSALTNGCA